MGERGIALILVLWILTLLSVIGMGFVYSVRTETSLAFNHVARAQAMALADGGVHRGLFEFTRPVVDIETGWKADGRVREISIAEGVVELRVVDEAAFIDLNVAPDELLRGLLLSQGVPEDEATGLMDAILDWRDQDDLVRDQGAEGDDYISAGRALLPTNQPFKSVDELMHVMGMTPEIYRRIAPALTVHSSQRGIDTATAAREVLMAVPFATPEEVDAFLDSRQMALAANQPIPPFPPAAAFAAATGNVYNFKAIARLPDGTTFVRHAVARLTRDSRNPFIFLDWKEGSL